MRIQHVPACYVNNILAFYSDLADQTNMLKKNLPVGSFIFSKTYEPPNFMYVKVISPTRADIDIQDIIKTAHKIAKKCLHDVDDAINVKILKEIIPDLRHLDDKQIACSWNVWTKFCLLSDHQDVFLCF